MKQAMWRAAKFTLSRHSAAMAESPVPALHPQPINQQINMPANNSAA
jgi:hypothetical protein